MEVVALAFGAYLSRIQKRAMPQSLRDFTHIVLFPMDVDSMGLAAALSSNLDGRVDRFKIRSGEVSPEGVETIVEGFRREEDPKGAVLGRGMVEAALAQLGERDGAPKGSVLVLLSDWPDEWNWFSYHGTTAGGGMWMFVHTAHWNRFFPGVPAWIPVAHLVFSGIHHGLFYPTMEAWTQRAHATPRGCLMDLCTEKSAIRLKMLAADVCPECARYAVERIEAGSLQTGLFHAVLQACDSLRTHFLAREREAVFTTIPTVRITRNEWKIEVEGWGFLRLQPRDCAVYVLLLRGGRFESDRNSPWQNDYRTLRNRMTERSHGRSETELKDPAFNQSIARIRSALIRLTSRKLADKLLWAEGDLIRKIKITSIRIIDEA